jgi:hypothetical protein
MERKLIIGFGLVVVWAVQAQPVYAMAEDAMGTAFTYQGRLTDNGVPANDDYDFQFMLCDAQSDSCEVAGTTVTCTVDPTPTCVEGGLFTVEVDCGSDVFNGNARWLKIGVRKTSEGGAYETLTERQALTPAPYALALPGLWTQQKGDDPPNLIGGFKGNIVDPGVVGAAIGGGGTGEASPPAGKCSGDSAILCQNDEDCVVDNGYCASEVVGGMCSETFTIRCDEDADCPPEEICVPDQIPGTCSDDPETPCLDDDDCPEGTCDEPEIPGTCSDDPEIDCVTDDDCVITNGFCNPDSSVGRCSEDPEILCVVDPDPCPGLDAGVCEPFPTINRVTANYGVVGGGHGNIAGSEGAGPRGPWPGFGATVGGGIANVAWGCLSTISGGFRNITAFTMLLNGKFSTIGGGIRNFVAGYAGTIGGGHTNRVNASARYGTIAGGHRGVVTGNAGAILGGYRNRVTASYGTVGAGEYNSVSGSYGTVGGGQGNDVQGDYSAIIGGGSNTAVETGSMVGGGVSNQAAGVVSTIGGGLNNNANGAGSTIGGGGVFVGNTAGPGWNATVGGGSGNFAAGSGATVPGGEHNDAIGVYSFAAGHRAKANNTGAFVWADSYALDFPSTGELNFIPVANQLLARTTGGVVFVSAIDGSGKSTAGVELPAGGEAWSTLSDRNAKANIKPVNGRDVLQCLANIPIGTWNYKSQDESIRHIGPTAQDFHAAFGLGENERSISTIDPDGVALAAIQGLYEIVQDRDAEIECLEEQNAELEARLAAIEALIAQQVQRSEGGAR